MRNFRIDHLDQERWNRCHGADEIKIDAVCGGPVSEPYTEGKKRLTKAM
jgi:hypothetical protein